MKIIWITWHRESSFKNTWEIKQKIYDYLDRLDLKESSFSLWWANWVDNWVWEYCIKHNIPYCLYLPFTDTTIQTKGWTSQQKKQYRQIVKYASNIVYWNWYFHRNRLIVDNSTQLVCVLKPSKRQSWTGYTVDYAKKKGVQVINILEM